jgi:SAM-dependent methyltransferase
MDRWTNNPTIATYDRIAAHYAATNVEGVLDDRLVRFTEAVAGGVPPGRFRILDAGCGPGQDSQWFHARGFQVVGVDLSAGMLAEARKRAPEVAFEQADLRHLAFPDGSFDGIWCCASLLHLPRADVPGVVRAFRRILRQGYLYVLGLMAGEGETVIDGQYGPDTPRLFTFFQRTEFELYLEQASFQIVDSVEQPWPNGTWPRLWILARTRSDAALTGPSAQSI